MENNWRQKSIENLEKQGFGDPNEAPTEMVRQCLQLCKTPLDQFTIEDIRLMIGQSFSLRYLVPMAVEHLRNDIFAEGKYYPGDLLVAVLNIDPEFWRDNKEAWKEIHTLITKRRAEISKRRIDTTLFDKVFK